MKRLFFASMVLATFEVAAGTKACVRLSIDNEALHVFVVNRGDYRLQVPRQLTLGEGGNLSLDIRKDGVAHIKVMEGYPPPATAQTDMIAVSPMHSYGVVVMRDYVERAYALASGCYAVSAIYIGIDGLEIRSPPVQLCVSK